VEEARPKEEAKEATSDFNASMLSFEGFVLFSVTIASLPLPLLLPLSARRESFNS